MDQKEGKTFSRAKKKNNLSEDEIGIRCEDVEGLINNEIICKKLIVKYDLMLRARLRREPTITGEDILHTVIEKYLSGERNWDRRNPKEFWQWVDKNMSSEVYNYANREFKSVKFDEIDEYEEDSYAQNFNYDNYPDDFDIVSDFEFNEMLNELKAELQDDDVAFLVFEYLLLGCENSEIAKELGIKVSEVVNAKKRIRRKLLKITKNKIW